MSSEQVLVATAASALIGYVAHKVNQEIAISSEFEGPKAGAMQERLDFVKALSRQEDVYERYMTPEARIMRFFFAVSPLPPIYVVSDKESVKRVLSDQKVFVRPDRPSKILKGVLDYALFIIPTDGPHWKKHRKLLQPGFGPLHLRHTATVAVSTMDKLQGFWNKRLEKNESVSVNLKNVLGCAAIDVIGLVAFGQDLKMVERVQKEDDPKWEALDTITSGGVLFRAVIPQFLWSAFGVANSSPKIAQATTEINAMLKGLATERRQAIADGTVGQEKWEMDGLQRLLLSSEEHGVTDEEIFGELMGFFLAGHETTANTLTFAFMELCKNQDIQEKLYESIKDIELSVQDEDIISKINSSRYLDCFLKEVMRLHSIVPRVPRMNKEDVVLQDKVIPKGSFIHVYIKGVHHNPNYHPNPTVFNPDRFEGEDIQPGTFLPFGDGGHMCIGFKMATIEAKIMLIQLIKSYKFDMVAGQGLREYYGVTKSLKDGLFVNVTARK